MIGSRKVPEIKDFSASYVSFFDINTTVSTCAVEGNRSYKDDYISEAYIAIYKCLEKYDSTLGAFATYATGAIRQEILYFMRNEQSMIKLGTTKLDEIK